MRICLLHYLTGTSLIIIILSIGIGNITFMYTREAPNTVIALLGLLLIAVVMITTVFQMVTISKPLKHISKNIQKISDGDLDVTFENSRVQEINEVVVSLQRILTSLKLAVLKVGIKREDLGIGTVLKAKEELERRSVFLIENTPDALIGINEKAKIVLWNPAATRLLGFSKTDAQGKNVSDIISEKKYGTFSKWFKQLHKTGQDPKKGEIIQSELIDKTGHKKIVELTVTHNNINGGSLTIASIRDVTHRQNKEKQDHKP
ncbi:hypothetical protein COT72_02930 [archaeon CG10_big_fil_rev_8_21_14_0_10_43_11]|nr:MAG: hypothetical protein COT72_02930 [archaeon CG10_big_fil_rev_8_21_14_0_10_43_11]